MSIGAAICDDEKVLDTKTSTATKTTAQVDDIEVGEIVAIDEAEEFLRKNDYSHAQIQELVQDVDKGKRLIRKVDLMMMPLLCGTYVLQYVDKQCLAYGAVFDLLSNTHMNTSQYAWLTTLFYLGYLVAEYPWSYAAQKWSVSKVVGICVVCWGGVLMIAAASHNFTGLAICRFFLGTFEAAITPIFMMVVGMWYTRNQQVFRSGMFYCCNGVGSMIGGILTYAIGQEDNFPVWKTIFILCGGITLCWGVVLFLFLPDNIMTAKRLTLDEKAHLIGRGKAAQTGILNRQIKWSQVREALIDPQVWLLFVFVLLNETINGGFANFSKLILKAVVGNNALKSTAMSIPSGAFQVFFILSGTYLASWLRNMRTVMMAIYLFPTIIGLSLLWKLPRTNEYGLLLAYYITGSFVASLCIALQMPAANLGGYTKRVTGTAFVFLAYCVGNVIGPHAFLAQEAPVYKTGCKVGLACGVAQVGCAILLRLLLVWRNKKKEAAAAAGLSTDGKIVDAETVQDLTDFENPHFRYVL